MDVISLSKANKTMKDAKTFHQAFLGEGVEAHFSSLDERLDWLEGQYSNAAAKEVYRLLVEDATLTNTEFKDGKLQLKKEVLAHPTYKESYASSGTYEKTFDFTSGFIQTLTMTSLTTAATRQSVTVEVATSEDGIVFGEYATLDIKNPPNSRFLKVKITLTSNDALTITYDTDIVLEEREGIQEQELIRSKSSDMTLDTSWVEEGSLHRKKITRNEWLRIDKLNILMEVN